MPNHLSWNAYDMISENISILAMVLKTTSPSMSENFSKHPGNWTCCSKFDPTSMRLIGRVRNLKPVTVSHAAGSDQLHVSIDTPASGPSSNNGLRAKKGEDLLAWISANQNQFTFCFPPNYFGPDLIFLFDQQFQSNCYLSWLKQRTIMQSNCRILLRGCGQLRLIGFGKVRQSRYAHCIVLEQSNSVAAV